MRKNQCDRYGDLSRYDMRRPTWPHCGKRGRGVQEGFPILRKLPRLDGPCPCGETIMDTGIPKTYRNCCVSKNRALDQDQSGPQTKEALEKAQAEVDEIFE